MPVPRRVQGGSPVPGIEGTIIDRGIFAARQALCRRPCTLDGEPATLSGAATQCAIVRAPGGLVHECTWAEAGRVMFAAAGAFVSTGKGKDHGPATRA